MKYSNIRSIMIWSLFVGIGVLIVGSLIPSSAYADTPDWTVTTADGSTQNESREWVKFGGRGGVDLDVDICGSISTSNLAPRIWAVTSPLKPYDEMNRFLPSVALNGSIDREQAPPSIEITLCNGDIEPLPRVTLTGPDGASVALSPESIKLPDDISDIDSANVTNTRYKLTYALPDNVDIGKYIFSIIDQDHSLQYPFEIVEKKWNFPSTFQNDDMSFTLKNAETDEESSVFRRGDSVHIVVSGAYAESPLQFELFGASRTDGLEKMTLPDGSGGEYTPDFFEIARTLITPTNDIPQVAFSFNMDLAELPEGRYLLVGRPIAEENGERGYYFYGDNFVNQPRSLGKNGVDLLFTARYFSIADSTIEIGETLSGDMQADGEKLFQFTAEAGQRIQASIPEDIGLNVEIETSSGEGYLPMPRFGSFANKDVLITQSGTYMLILRHSTYTDERDMALIPYSITLKEGAEMFTLGLDQTSSFVFENGSPVHVHRVEGFAGQSVQLTLTILGNGMVSDNISMGLLDSNGEIISPINATSESNQLQYTFFLPKSQAYYVTVDSENNSGVSTFWNYDLSLTEVDRLSQLAEITQDEPILPPVINNPGCSNRVSEDLTGIDVTIEDEAVIQRGQSVTKTWRITNAGTCTWWGEYKLQVIGSFTDVKGCQELRNNGIIFSDSALVNINASAGPPRFAVTPPNTATEISVELTAPSEPGNYCVGWQMIDPSGQPFGIAPYVYFIVR